MSRLEYRVTCFSPTFPAACGFVTHRTKPQIQAGPSLSTRVPPFQNKLHKSLKNIVFQQLYRNVCTGENTTLDVIRVHMHDMAKCKDLAKHILSILCESKE